MRLRRCRRGWNWSCWRSSMEPITRSLACSALRLMRGILGSAGIGPTSFLFTDDVLQWCTISLICMPQLPSVWCQRSRQSLGTIWSHLPPMSSWRCKMQHRSGWNPVWSVKMRLGTYKQEHFLCEQFCSTKAWGGCFLSQCRLGSAPIVFQPASLVCLV